jgi:hypothetical protein
MQICKYKLCQRVHRCYRPMTYPRTWWVGGGDYGCNLVVLVSSLENWSCLDSQPLRVSSSCTILSHVFRMTLVGGWYMPPCGTPVKCYVFQSSVPCLQLTVCVGAQSPLETFSLHTYKWSQWPVGALILSIFKIRFSDFLREIDLMLSTLTYFSSLWAVGIFIHLLFLFVFLRQGLVIVQGNLEPTMLLLNPPKCWDYKHAPSHPD